MTYSPKAGTEGSFGVGSVLARSFTIFLNDFAAFLVISLVTSSPIYLYFLWANYGSGFDYGNTASDALSAIWVVTGIVTAIEIVLTYAATAAISYGALRQLQGRTTGFSESVSKGFSLVLPVIFVSFAASVLILLGFMMLVIPGLVFSVMFWVVVPVAVIERPGIQASLERSGDLTKGYRWPILGLLLLSIAMERGYTYIAEQVLNYETQFDLSLAIEWGGGAMLIAFWAVVAAVTYHDLRRIKEGTDIDQIAAVFD